MRPLAILSCLLNTLAYTIVFPCCSGIFAQTPAARDYAGELSPPIRAVDYTARIFPDRIVPDWDRGYVLSHGIEVYSSADEATVVMYGHDGQPAREGHIWPPAAQRVRLIGTATTHEGAIIAAGWAGMPDGSVSKFIAKTDLLGNTIKTIMTGSFVPRQMCEAEDGTVWSLGIDVPSPDPDSPSNVLRQFSFEKGLLRGYLPFESVKAPVNSNTRSFNPFGSYVRCGKDKVVAYLKFTDEYVEVDTKSFEGKRWKLDLSSTNQGKASALGITDDAHVYVSFGGHGCRESEVRGLFEIKADSKSLTATLLPVKGTVSLRHCGSPENPPQVLEEGKFERLWGTDGSTLAIGLAGQNLSDIVWVKVISQEVASN